MATRWFLLCFLLSRVKLFRWRDWWQSEDLNYTGYNENIDEEIEVRVRKPLTTPRCVQIQEGRQGFNFI